MCQRRIYKNTNTQIHKHTNTKIQHITKSQKDPPCGIFLKRGLFKDVKYEYKYSVIYDRILRSGVSNTSTNTTTNTNVTYNRILRSGVSNTNTNIGRHTIGY